MWAFLISVSTEIEADILVGLLEQENIPTRKIFPGVGNLRATYGLINGVEIYVPEDYIIRAKELIDSPTLESPFPEDDD